MEYTILRLARLAGVSTRTLRYYDQIDLLKPASFNASGYRLYGEKEVNTLQQILFYRELGMELNDIRDVLESPGFDGVAALTEHRRRLVQKREQLDLLIANVEKSLAAAEGRTMMSDKEKFEGFKQKMIQENEEKYGREARQKYGDDAVDRSNEMVKNMTPEQHERLTRLTEELSETLSAAVTSGDPAGELAQKAADLHRQWLTFFWNQYTPEAHAGLARMYVEDERFAAYYDKIQPGAAAFLRDAILIYTGQTE